VNQPNSLNPCLGIVQVGTETHCTERALRLLNVLQCRVKLINIGEPVTVQGKADQHCPTYHDNYIIKQWRSTHYDLLWLEPYLKIMFGVVVNAYYLQSQLIGCKFKFYVLHHFFIFYLSSAIPNYYSVLRHCY
jgi:hypothetical protein